MLSDPPTYPSAVQHLAGRAAKKPGLKEALSLAFEVDTSQKNTGTTSQRLYGDYETRLQSPLQRRHQSILAHGIKPVSAEGLQPLLGIPGIARLCGCPGLALLVVRITKHSLGLLSLGPR